MLVNEEKLEGGRRSATGCCAAEVTAAKLLTGLAAMFYWSTKGRRLSLGRQAQNGWKGGREEDR